MNQLPNLPSIDAKFTVSPDELEAIRQEHEWFLAKVETAVVEALCIYSDEAFDEVKKMLDAYNPQTKKFDEDTSGWWIS